MKYFNFLFFRLYFKYCLFVIAIFLCGSLQAQDVSKPKGKLLFEGQSITGDFGIFSYSFTDKKTYKHLIQQVDGNKVNVNIQSPEWVVNSNFNEFLISKWNEETNKFEINLFEISSMNKKQMLKNDKISYYNPAFSNFGKYIAVNGYSKNEEFIYIYTKEFKKQLLKISTLKSVSDSYLSWSYDDKYISKVKDKNVYMYDLKSSSAETLDVVALQFSFSPQENVGAYISNDSVLTLINLETKEKSKTQLDNIVSFSWSPDGKYIAYVTPVEKSFVDIITSIFRNDRLKDKQVVHIATKEGIFYSSLIEVTKINSKISWR